VIWGRHDALYPAAFGQRLAKEIRGAGFRLMDTGHTPLEESPEELALNIRRFCSSSSS
jgi:pimeloyl-ACP methyl ester carboxylesterase